MIDFLTGWFQGNFGYFATIVPLDFSEIVNIFTIRVTFFLSIIQEEFSKKLRAVIVFKLFMQHETIFSKTIVYEYSRYRIEQTSITLLVCELENLITSYHRMSQRIKYKIFTTIFTPIRRFGNNGCLHFKHYRQYIERE